MHTHYIDVTIDPVGVVAYIAHDNLTVTCTAIDCKDSIRLEFLSIVNGSMHDIGLCTTELEEEYSTNIRIKTCNITVDVRNNGTLLLCGVVRRPSGNNHSEVLEILVQGQLYINLFNIIFS